MSAKLSFKLGALPVLAVVFLTTANADAQRVIAPVKNGQGAPPDINLKVTRVDFEEKAEAQRLRDERLAQLEREENEAENEIVREAKRIERENALAQQELLREQERLLKQQKPEDFVSDVSKVQMTAAPKKASVHEVEVTDQAVVAAARQVVVRRSRSR